ncbi:hypothetical protein BX600DRAFT_506788 [Xylariales sp. PMI_506]|nr:hypothetical protein BX600DRAFT_506788 [Xylariales sp. PMI_506]
MAAPPPIPPRPPGYELRGQVNPGLPPRPAAQGMGQQQQYQYQYQYPYQPQQHQQQQQQQQYTQPSYPYPYGAAIPPPPPPPLASQYQHPQQQQQNWGGGYTAPPQPPQVAPIAQRSTGEPSAWSAFNYPDGAPTPFFEAMMAALFQKLDPQGTGYITPEVMSEFLDVNQFLTEHNIWKSNLKGNALYPPEDVADAEMKAACEAWFFDHKVVIRGPPGRRQLPYGGMPLLSLRGLTDMMAVEYAADPELGWRGVNASLRRYGVWPALGPAPRECLLPDRPPQVQQRIEAVTVRSARAAQEKLAAVRTKHMLQQQGQQAALDLLDDRVWVRRYY